MSGDDRRKAVAELQRRYDENVDAFHRAVDAGTDTVDVTRMHANRETEIVADLRRLGARPLSRAEREMR